MCLHNLHFCSSPLPSSKGAGGVVPAIFEATLLLVSTGLIEIWHLVAAGLVQGSVFAFNPQSGSPEGAAL